MPTLCREIENVQNTALGASLLWRAATGYSEAAEGKPCPLPLLFLILPVLFQEDAAEFAIHTRKNSGLQLYVQKFSDTSAGKSDLLLGISKRAIAMRHQTLDAFRLALSEHLIALRIESGDVFSLSTTEPVANIPEAIRPLLEAAEKLGYWLGQRTLFEIQQLLKVRL